MHFSDKPTVLAVGLFVPGTGFTRVYESLFARLSSFFTIHWLGIGYKGPVTVYANYTLHPCNVKGGDIYGAYGAAALARELEAASVLLLNDVYLLKNYEQTWLPLKKSGTRLVAYLPLDGQITDASIIKDCLFPDKIVMYSQWAVDEMKTAYTQYSSANTASKLPDISFIYHGVDQNLFMPADEMQQTLIKQEIFSTQEDAAQAIFILNANRYNERKDLEATIAAFAKALPFCEKPVYLCLHTPNLPVILQNKLSGIIANSGCSDRIILNPLGNEYVSEKALVKLYQACSIGVNTSLGEGWGLISFEHAACGAAQIVPGHTTPAECWKDVALLTDTANPVKLPTNPFQMYQVDADVLTKQIARLVNDNGYRVQMAARCQQHTSAEIFNWEYIAAQWEKMLC